MKFTKTVKYNYKLTEETLEKDIDKFILLARKGNFSWDSKLDREGLRLIKGYFKILKDKLNEKEYEECKNCYEKLILFLFDASRGDDKADFGYEDLLATISNNFDYIIKDYFICLIKTCDIPRLADRVSNYASKLKDYGFYSDKEILLNSLKKEELARLEELMLIKIENMTKKEEDKQEILYFLLSLAEVQENKEKYMRLCERFRGVIEDSEVDELKEEYNEN